jgi:hypothetical protein
MAGVRSINFAVGSKDSISSSPAEAYGSNFSGAWDLADGGDERVDERLGNTLTMLD